jgi:cyclase
MVRERVAENVYLFTSERYAQVNAGVVVGPDWSVVIDTLAFPEETLEIRSFVEERLSSPVRYVINTHHHADHTLGNCMFPKAVVIGHVLCRELLDTRVRQALEESQAQNRDLHDIKIVLPEVLFEDGDIHLRVGKRTLQLIGLPGHSPDGMGVLLVEDRLLFSGDVMMPVPYIPDGDIDSMAESLKRLPRLKLENIIQGHGEVVLRGEVQTATRSSLNYLAAIQRQVKKAARRRDPMEYLDRITIEECGKSRILLGGLAPQLHNRNLRALYAKLYGDS